jgi:hypothetical protein
VNIKISLADPQNMDISCKLIRLQDYKSHAASSLRMFVNFKLGWEKKKRLFPSLGASAEGQKVLASLFIPA